MVPGCWQECQGAKVPPCLGAGVKVPRHLVVLHFMHYNFCRIHKTLRVTPAMEAGIASHVWSVEEIIGLLDRPVEAAA